MSTLLSNKHLKMIALLLSTTARNALVSSAKSYKTFGTLIRFSPYKNNISIYINPFFPWTMLGFRSLLSQIFPQSKDCSGGAGERLLWDYFYECKSLISHSFKVKKREQSVPNSFCQDCILLRWFEKGTEKYRNEDFVYQYDTIFVMKHKHRLTSFHYNIICNFLGVIFSVCFDNIILIKGCICEFWYVCISAECHRNNTDFGIFQKDGSLSNVLFSAIWFVIDNYNQDLFGIRTEIC